MVVPVFAASAAPAPTPQQPKEVTFTFLDPNLPLTARAGNFTVLFNPKELNVDKSVPWGLHDKAEGDAPSLEFTAGEPMRMSVELMFDGYETQTNVSRVVAMLEKFVAPPGEKRPPPVLLQWGQGLQFKCILESFSLRFTLFLEDGTPVRATMNTVFLEFRPVKNQTSDNPRH